MPDLPIYPLHPSASIGGYEWRIYELEQELSRCSDLAQSSVIRETLTQVVANFRRANPGKLLSLCPSPFHSVAVATRGKANKKDFPPRA